MENVYKVKVKTNPDPHWLYPSERRYSASIVLGLGVVHLAFALLSLLMACVTLTSTNNTEMYNKTKNFSNNYILDNDTNYSDQRIDPCITLTLGSCLMCIGSLAAGFTALLAWKRWYMDHNIKWFFCMSLLSTTTSLICLILVIVIIILTNSQFYSNIFLTEDFNPSTKDMISINILIASGLEQVWSILSLKVSFCGMINEYPDDIVFPKGGGKIEVNTIHRGNAKGKTIPPDILNHYSVKGKIPKHLQKKPNCNLPKDESNSEYYERVNKFLSSDVDTNSSE